MSSKLAFFPSFLRTLFAHTEFVSSARRHKSRDRKILFFNLYFKYPITLSMAPIIIQKSLMLKITLPRALNGTGKLT